MFIDEEDVRSVADVVRSGNLAQGERVEAFERSVARFLHQKGGAAVSSGTAGLHLALQALGVHEGDAVAMPSYVCSALLHATESVGARPVLVDGSDEGYNLDPEDLERLGGRLPRGLAAVIVPHAFGSLCDISKVRDAVGDVPVVEDCAQAIGDPVVGLGDVIVCSFYATKMMTTGEGGMVLSRDDGVIDRIRDMRDYDMKPDHRARFNYKMTDLQAALGLSQLKKLPKFVDRRRELSRLYGREQRTCYRYVLPTSDLESALNRFERKGIHARRPVYAPLHQYLGLPDSDFPKTSRAMRTALSIPLYPALTDADVTRIRNAMREIFP